MNATAATSFQIPFWRSAVVLGLVGLTMAVCLLGTPPSAVSESGVNMELPASVAGFTGKELPVSESEREILPADTEFAKMLYSNAAGNEISRHEISCQIVLAGAEKRSIHRPEVCLPGQGWTLKSGEVETVTLSNGKNLEVMKLMIGRPVRLPNGDQKELTSIFTYWFVGKDSTTPHHLVRILKTNFDMLLHNTNNRWAYIIASAPVLEGFAPNGLSAAATEELLRKFIADVAPSIMSAP